MIIKDIVGNNENTCEKKLPWSEILMDEIFQYID